MLDYLVYVLKCLGCISAMLVIIFLTVQILYVNPKNANKKQQDNKEFKDKLMTEFIKAYMEKQNKE